MPAISPTFSSTRCWPASSSYLMRKPAAAPLHRHPRRHRPLRSRRRRGGAHRRMARRHRQARSGAAPRPRRADLLAPYLARRRAARRARASPLSYPGSPALAQNLLRDAGPHHPVRAPPGRRRNPAHHHGARQARQDRRASTATRALNAFVPPPERRGVVLVDPPFEAPRRVRAAAGGLFAAPPQLADRHLHGLVPAQGPARGIRRFADALARSGIRAHPAGPSRGRRHPGVGRRPARRVRPVVVNPPFGLRSEPDVLMPFLAQAMGRAGAALVGARARPARWRGRSADLA